MTRSLRFWLAAAVLFLFAVNVVWGWWRDRGLITVHVDSQPLGKVIDSIEWQGGIKLATNMERDTPITMHFDKVPVTEALERLAGATDSRWNLAYLYAPNRDAIREALSAFSTGRLPETWRTFRMSAPDILVDEDIAPIDPRTLNCIATLPSESKLHAYLSSFSQATDAMAAAPEDWNPDISKPLKEEETPKVAGMIARTTNSEMVETFLLIGQRERPQQEGEQNADGPRQARWGQGGGGRNGGGRRNVDPELLAKRAEQQIARLPADRQQEARADYEAQRAFWQELQALPEEERRKKMEERMNDPAVQERMAKRQEYRDSKSSPEKRFERYKRYRDRKAEMTKGNT